MKRKEHIAQTNQIQQACIPQPQIPPQIIGYMSDPKTRIPNPMRPIYAVWPEPVTPTVQPIDPQKPEPARVIAPQAQFWLEKPMPTWKQLIKSWLNR